MKIPKVNKWLLGALAFVSVASIATYAMAEEALDIKTLSTLLMATPKVDIRQAVGRILRNNKGDKLVVDIIDQHEIFQRHWKKR